MITPPRSYAGRPNQICYFRVDDVDDHYENAVTAGAAIEVAPTADDDGRQYYVCRDLEGFLWSFGNRSFERPTATAPTTRTKTKSALTSNVRASAMGLIAAVLVASPFLIANVGGFTPVEAAKIDLPVQSAFASPQTIKVPALRDPVPRDKGDLRRAPKGPRETSKKPDVAKLETDLRPFQNQIAKLRDQVESFRRANKQLKENFTAVLAKQKIKLETAVRENQQLKKSRRELQLKASLTEEKARAALSKANQRVLRQNLRFTNLRARCAAQQGNMQQAIDLTAQLKAESESALEQREHTLVSTQRELDLTKQKLAEAQSKYTAEEVTRWQIQLRLAQKKSFCSASLR